MSSYRAFVASNIRSMPGSTPQEKMRAVADAWRAQSGMGKGKKRVGKRTKSTQTGEGFFSSLWDGIKKAVKVVGPIASMIPGPVGTVAKVVTAGSKLLGNGLDSIHDVPMTPQVRKHLKKIVGGRVLTSASQAEKMGYQAVMDAVKASA